MLAEQTAKPGLVLEWPFDEEQLKEKSEVIRKLSPDTLRAASANIFAELLLRSISSRKAHEAETRDPLVLAQLPQAYRDFSKWNSWGLGDLRRADINKIQNSFMNERSDEFMLLRTWDAAPLE